MPSPEASRRNLANYYKRVPRPRSPDESLLIKMLTLQWFTSDPRRPPTQHEWAAQLGVSQQYVSKMCQRFKREWLALANKWDGWQDVTLDDLQRSRERRQRATARVAEDRAWERYDAEQRRKQRAAAVFGARTSDDEPEDD